MKAANSLDNVDKSLLRHLQGHGRATNAELAEAARTLLRLLDNPEKKKIQDRNADGRGLDRLSEWLRFEIANETSQHRKKKKLKRLKVVDALRTSGDTPDTLDYARMAKVVRAMHAVSMQF